MRIGKEELYDLKEDLELLLDFVRKNATGEMPYFYRCFGAMKSNIEIFFYTGEDNISDFFPILERDWKASHAVLIGVQEYDPREGHPEMDPMLCVYFARLLAEVGKYFERL